MTRPTRRAPVVVLLAATIGSVCGLANRAAAEPADAVATTTTTTGLRHVGVGEAPSVAADGRRLVYLAPSAVAVDAEGIAMPSAWLLDRTTGVSTELTLAIDGTRPGRTAAAVISGDGCSVVVTTEIAYDLFRDDDTGARWDVYRTILPGCPAAFEPGEWELISSVDTVDSIGQPTIAASDAADPTDRPRVNESGDVVAFTSTVAAPAGQVRPWTAISVADLTIALGQPGRVTAVPGLPAEGPSTATGVIGQRQAALSGDGRFVAFTTDTVPTAVEDEATGDVDFPATWTTLTTPAASAETLPTAVTQVYVWNRMPSDADDAASAWFRLASAGPAGQPGSASSSGPAINRDGDVVAFTSVAPDLLPTSIDATTAGISQVYRWTAEPTPDSSPLSVVSQREGALGDASSSAPALDATGRLVAFETRSTNLVVPPAVATVSTDGADLLLADTAAGSFRRLTVRPDGQPAARSARRPAMSATGRVVAFEVSDPTTLGLEPASTSGWQLLVDELPTELASSDLELGTTAPGTVSDTWFTTIVNHGQAAFLPDSITTTNSAFRLVGGTCRPDVAVMPGESCTVEVAFAPSIEGPATAEIVVAEQGAAAERVSVAVSASAGTPSIELSPTSASYGEELVGLQTEAAMFSVVNTAAIPVRVDAVALAGEHPGDFVVTTDECSGRVLAPSTVCELAVLFAPTADGPRSATVTAIGTGDVTASAVVSGVGAYTPMIGVAQTTMASGGQVDVSGLGFPAFSAITLTWAGSSTATVIETDERGEFTARVLAPRRLPAGHQHLVAVDPSGRYEPVAAPEVLITRAIRAGGSSPALRPGG